MNKKLLAVLVCLVQYTPLLAFQQNSGEYYDYELQELKKNIFISKRKEPLRHYVEGNFVIIINKKNVAVIDATGSPHAARLVINDIKELTNKPVAHLINTHFHGDHTFGNQAFLAAYPRIKILSSKSTYDIMSQRVKTFTSFTLNDSLFNERIKQTNAEIEALLKSPGHNASVIANLQRHRDQDLPTVKKIYSELKITPPNTIIEDTLEINDGTRKIVALYLGKGDTPGDIWIFLPNEKILLAGDAVVHPVPYGFSNTPLEWLETLKRASTIDFDILIPGHGDIQYGKTYILQLIDVLSSLKNQLNALISKGATADESAAQIDIQELQNKFTGDDPLLKYYFNEYFKEPIVKRMYAEIKNSLK